MNRSLIQMDYSLSLSGRLVAHSKTARLTPKVWEQCIKDIGGLHDRKVELICMDDKGEASKTAAIAANARRFCF